MSFDNQIKGVLPMRVVNEEAMLSLVREYGLIPFTAGTVKGWSIEEMTPQECWFTDDCLGPWDWKIHCVQSGEVAYGKFLAGGKAAFATRDWYRELMNYRRSLPRYSPDSSDRIILDFLAENGTVTSSDVRRLLGVKKSAADAAATRLEMQCRLVIGDITRVYRGPDLHYNGWQRAAFCSPEALFGWDHEGAHDVKGPGGFPFVDDDVKSFDHTPEESLRLLVSHIRQLFPDAPETAIIKALS
ncbi:MAG: hypothetical protein IK031_02285 [Bacteroidales bacterium]|nr:hypothetical protein [Bacteroidales bacterium]